MDTMVLTRPDPTDYGGSTGASRAVIGGCIEMRSSHYNSCCLMAEETNGWRRWRVGSIDLPSLANAAALSYSANTQ